MEENIETFYSYAFSHYHGGHWNEALKAFLVLCTKRPTEFRFWFGLGATFQEMGKYIDALHAWAMSALLQKSDPYPHFHAAECYLSLRNGGDALKALSEAEERLTPHHPLRTKIALLKEQWREYQ
ncbi:MAG: tetratricopeptide repeat protein [Chlamydiia bacterium]|nr:tetratricopeptide repeat protein [Chlamydiia bacterium]